RALALLRGPDLLAAVRHRAGPEVRAAGAARGLLVGRRLALHLDGVPLLQHAQPRVEGVDLHGALRLLGPPGTSVSRRAGVSRGGGARRRAAGAGPSRRRIGGHRAVPGGSMSTPQQRVPDATRRLLDLLEHGESLSCEALELRLVAGYASY